MKSNQTNFGRVMAGIVVYLIVRYWGIPWISRAAMNLAQWQHPEVQWVNPAERR